MLKIIWDILSLLRYDIINKFYVERHINSIGFDDLILEIGGGFNPRFKKVNYKNAYHLDHCDTENLKNKYSADINVAHLIGNIQDVDFVFDGSPIEELVPDDLHFDYVYSSHCLEHQVDLVSHFISIEKLLKPDGKLFVHIFSHREFAREYDADDPTDWMAQTFFSGGTMPSDDLLLYFQGDLELLEDWRMNGWHYQKTLNAWLAKLDSQQGEVRRIIAETYGPENEARWLANWRLFFLGCSEVWGLKDGREYLVSHYLFGQKRNAG